MRIILRFFILIFIVLVSVELYGCWPAIGQFRAAKVKGFGFFAVVTFFAEDACTNKRVGARPAAVIITARTEVTIYDIVFCQDPVFAFTASTTIPRA